MGSATTCKEVIVTCKNELGALAKATMLLKQNNINVEATCCYPENNNAKFHFITNNNAKAKEVFTTNKWNVTESDVVCWTTSNTPGTLHGATTALAEAKVDTIYCYTSAPKNATTQNVVFCTNNNTKANDVLNKCCGGTTTTKGTSCCG